MRRNLLENFTPLDQGNNNENVPYAVSVRNLELRYELYYERVYTFVSWTGKLLRNALVESKSAEQRPRFHTVFKDLSFTLPKGEVLGIIGNNGSGKTTLLRVISGILTPHAGEICVNGKVGTILGIGAGFNKELTGRVNIVLNGLVLGLSRKAINERMDEIIQFAELEDFIDQPIKYYSSGMISRLGFSIATNIEADILLMDEVLSVGDIGFQKKAANRMQELRNRASTQIIVSHSMSFIRENCTKVLYLHQGEIVHYGDTEEGVDKFISNNTK